MRTPIRSLALILSFFPLAIIAVAQQPTLSPVPYFPLASSPMTIHQRAQAKLPFSVTGETGAILGQEDGSFELWQFPVKVFSQLHLTAELEGYPVPIDVTALAATIDAAPDHTTITYSHAAVTVRQHMFLARGSKDESAPIVLFEIQAVRPVVLTVNLEPVMERMWPALNGGRPGGSWVPMGSGGGYFLETDDPTLYGMVAMPNAQPGILAPYQERPHEYPLQFKVSYDPKRDGDKCFPLIATVMDNASPQEHPGAELAARTAKIAAELPELYAANRDYYAHFFDHRLTAETPDAKFDEALRWAEVAIDQLKVRKGDELGLVAGVYPSADSDRPGFGWFFGRDTLWTTYALHAEGDFGLSRHALEFLMARQREDGKIMHEYSQSADRVNWAAYGYEYAAADATPLFVLAMQDYLQSSGDLAFVRSHWENVKRAYRFTRTHDSDGDGIYDNAQGTGWVESWPPGMPHQELYLAALDQQSCAAMATMANALSEAGLAKSAHDTAEMIRGKLNGYLGADGIYSFSKNMDGTYDTTPTIYPSVAWWTGELTLPNAAKTLDLYAGSELSADWGSRAIAESNKFYDPISYHQGSIWPLFTGWAAMAEFRAGRSLAGLQHLWENVRLTWTGDPGDVTELLSGEFYEPLGRSTAHQLWSSAMVVTPAVRGMFGIEADVANHTLVIAPQLPAEWAQAALHHVPFGADELEVRFARQNGNMRVEVTSAHAISLCVLREKTDTECHAAAAVSHVLNVPLPPVEVSLPKVALSVGDASHNLRVVNQQYGNGSLVLTLEARGGTEQVLRLQKNDRRVKNITAEGGNVEHDAVRVDFPAGEGFVRKTVALHW